MTDHSLTFELVNDKAELEEALVTLASEELMDYGSYWDNPHVSSEAMKAINTVLTLVPRLMRSYEEALELTHTLADAWESYMNNQTPAGLYVP